MSGQWMDAFAPHIGAETISRVIDHKKINRNLTHKCEDLRFCFMS